MSGGPQIVYIRTRTGAMVAATLLQSGSGGLIADPTWNRPYNGANGNAIGDWNPGSNAYKIYSDPSGTHEIANSGNTMIAPIAFGDPNYFVSVVRYLDGLPSPYYSVL